MMSTYTIRHLRVGDVLSADLLGNWNVCLLDCRWVWVAENGQIEGLLIAAPMHGLLFLLRVAAHKDAPKIWLLDMLRTVLKETKDQGFVAAMTYLGPHPHEEKLVRIAKRAGWMVVPESGVWCMGPLGEY